MEYVIHNTDSKGLETKPYLVFKNEKYGALGDDFSNLKIDNIIVQTKKIKNVINGKLEKETIYGYVCYSMQIDKEQTKIYEYNEYLGVEPSSLVHDIFKEYCEALNDWEKKNT